LIDESLHRDFEGQLADLEVSTVRGEDWLGLRNGVLLRAAAATDFDVRLRMLVPQIRSILPLLHPGDAYEIAPLKGDAICDREVAA
jgi:hypothetical protein